jgi:hypothetical protein
MLEALKERLGDIRERNELRGAAGPPQIGCIVLVQAVFFPPDLWVRQPSDWAARNLRYKRYDLSQGEGARIWGECQERAAATAPAVSIDVPLAVDGERYGPAVLLRPPFLCRHARALAAGPGGRPHPTVCARWCPRRAERSAAPVRSAPAVGCGIRHRHARTATRGQPPTPR